MWWLQLTSFLLSTAMQQGEAMIATPNFELSTMGYNPLLTDVMECPDHATKGKIFTAQQEYSVYGEKKDRLNYFINEVQHANCSPFFTEDVAHTYEKYRSLTTAAISFDTKEDETTPLGAAEFYFKDKAGYGNQNNPNAVFIRDFINQSEREVRLVKVACVTHTISILHFYEPVFTTAFISALHNLHETATNPNSETKRKVFSKFVRSYGTHFARTTHFGYAAYFVKLFETQAKTTAEKAVRRRCMMESARETLTPGSRRRCETTGQHFSRLVAAKCGEEEVEELVTVTGSASVSDAGDCDLAVKESPRPVAYNLQKISALFDETWISLQSLANKKVRLNGTVLSAYFAEQLGEYSQNVIEKAESASREQCFWRRFITPSAAESKTSRAVVTGSSEAENKTSTAVVTGSCEAENKTSTAVVTGSSVAENKTPTAVVTGPSEAEDKTCSVVNGLVIIVGGTRASRTLATPYSTALFAPALPPFPIAVYGNTLSKMGAKLYSCGGSDSSSKKKCWVIDTGIPNGTWKYFDIEWGLAHHSAVVVQEEIWFFSNSNLHILQTRNSGNKFRKIRLDFSFRSYICAVAHGSHTFVIGVGGGRTDVYINKDYTKPEQWERYATLQQGRHAHGCIMFAEEVIVTGGFKGLSRTRLISVEAINVVNRTVRSLAPLTGARRVHRMAIIHGRPAVLGGYNEDGAMSSIEAYDGRNNAWETLGYSLSEPRYYFGLEQYFP